MVPSFLHPSPSTLPAFRRALQGGLPSAVRWAKERWREMGQVPSILAVDLIGTEGLLAELETLTPAQFAAMEACHRINVRRLRQRSIVGWNWRSLLAGLVGAIVGLVSAAEYVGILKLKDIDLWSLTGGVTMWGMDTLSVIARMVIAGFIFVLLQLIVNGMRFFPFLQRLRAFEDILTIAKAYRKGQAETPKDTTQKATIEDSESVWR
jgi:hypothetical protein